MIFLRWIYLTFAAPLMPIVFKTGAVFSAKLKRGVEVRKKISGRPSWLVGEPATKPIWFHCASGEFEYAKPVIRLLKQHYPEIKILVTYFSTSAQKAVESFSGVDMAVPFPWENAKNWQEFLDFYEPRVLLVARTDTWPEMLYQTGLRKIPSLLFSATLVEGSGRLKFAARLFTKLGMQNLTQIFCVSEGDAKLFSELGFGAKSRVAGDTRYDQVLFRLDSAQAKSDLTRNKIINPSDLRKIFVAGSTWSEDEAQLLPVFAKLREKIKCIIAPHEPTAEHLRELTKKLESLGLSFSLYSESNNNTDVVVVDQVGILAELYLLGDFAFVGGSFRKTVHSVMEPLAAGCLTFVGPLHLNNREAIEFQNLLVAKSFSPVQKILHGQNLMAALELLLNLPVEQLNDLKSQIKDEVRKRAGRSELVVKWVQGIV